LSFDAADAKKPEFLRINPRGKVPAIVDGEVTLYESSAIVEYLEDAYPERRVWPRDVKARATARRIAVETDVYFAIAVRNVMRSTLFKPVADHDPVEIAAAKAALAPEIAWCERVCANGFVAGEPSAADFGLYPWLAILGRLELKQPQHRVHFSDVLRAYSAKIEGLPYFARTIPPHWKA
jgi:glutathione S-transferase